MTDTDPDLVALLSEAGHAEQAASLATKLATDPNQSEEQRVAALPASERINHALSAAGNRHSGDVNADIRSAAGFEVLR